MRKTAGILTACLLLAGCAAGQRPGMSRPQLPPTQPTVIETPVAVTEPTAAPGERLLLVEYNLQGGTIRPVDGLTLVDLPAHQPISIRHHFDHAFSPDGAALYWLQPASKEPAHGAPREFALVRYSVTNGGVA